MTSERVIEWPLVRSKERIKTSNALPEQTTRAFASLKCPRCVITSQFDKHVLVFRLSIVIFVTSCSVLPPCEFDSTENSFIYFLALLIKKITQSIKNLNGYNKKEALSIIWQWNLWKLIFFKVGFGGWAIVERGICDIWRILKISVKQNVSEFFSQLQMQILYPVASDWQTEFAWPGIRSDSIKFEIFRAKLIFHKSLFTRQVN